MAYHWPGNVRELETIIQRAVILTGSPILQPNDLELPFTHEGTVAESGTFREVKARVLEQFERTYLTNLLAAHQGNISHAAKQAGKERGAFKRLMQKYNLNRRAFLA